MFKNVHNKALLREEGREGGLCLVPSLGSKTLPHSHTWAPSPPCSRQARTPGPQVGPTSPLSGQGSCGRGPVAFLLGNTPAGRTHPWQPTCPTSVFLSFHLAPFHNDPLAQAPAGGCGQSVVLAPPCLDMAGRVLGRAAPHPPRRSASTSALPAQGRSHTPVRPPCLPHTFSPTPVPVTWWRAPAGSPDTGLPP